MVSKKTVEIEVAIAAIVIAVIVTAFATYSIAKPKQCLYPQTRSAMVINVFGKVYAIPPNKLVKADWGEAKYVSKCDEAEGYVKFKSGLTLKFYGEKNGDIRVEAYYAGQKCDKVIKYKPVLPYVGITLSVNKVIVSAYGKILVINFPQLSCSLVS